MKSSHPLLDKLLTITVDNGASDLHLHTNERPALRRLGEIEFVDHDAISHEMLHQMLESVLTQKEIEELLSIGHVDTDYAIEGVARFRANYLLTAKGFGAVFRVVPTDMPSLNDLNMPPVIREISLLRKGLVVVTGPTGSGKSTTLAAMVDFINDNRDCHIMTIEDPIEFVHPIKKAVIQQRQVGVHALSFSRALRAALRESPDIILLGEMRDVETVGQALAAAETGHLVFATLHTNSAAKTVDRIIDVFPSDEQASIRGVLSNTLKAVIAQQLLPTADGSSRVAVQEIMKVNVGVAGLIREGKTSQLSSFITMGVREGMQSFDKHLGQLVKEGRVSMETAMEYAQDEQALLRAGAQVPGQDVSSAAGEYLY